MASEYLTKLKDPRWQMKRLEILQRDNWTCQHCSTDKRELHVHHKTYVFGNQPWEYHSSNFITLCKKCHDQEEDAKTKTNDLIHDLLFAGVSYESIYKHLQQLIP